VTIAPVDELARRIAVAERMAERYAAADGVAAVLLAGSVARGLADARSDVEVDVYWRRAPSDAERRAVVDDAGWEWVYAEVDEHEWADGVRLDGVKVDVSQFVTATIDGYLDALREGDTEPELQVRATALLDGRALAGDGLIEDWRARLAEYPEALALAMLDQADRIASAPRQFGGSEHAIAVQVHAHERVAHPVLVFDQRDAAVVVAVHAREVIAGGVYLCSRDGGVSEHKRREHQRRTPGFQDKPGQEKARA